MLKGKFNKKYALRKTKVAFGSVAIATLFAIAGNSALASDTEEVSPTTDKAGSVVTASKESVEVVGNVTVTTKEVESPELNKAVKEAQEAGVKTTQTDTIVQESVEASKADYARQIEAINNAKKENEAKNAEYEAKVKEVAEKNKAAQAKFEGEKAQKDAEYKAAYAEYEKAKKAYDEYIAGGELKEAELAQELTFAREGNVVHTIEVEKGEAEKGNKIKYLTKKAVEKLGNNIVDQFRSNELTSSDEVASSPWGNKADEWIKIKKGDKFSVTYNDLNESNFVKKDGTGVKNDIKTVKYHYEILDLPSSNGEGIAKISKDPTVTITVGSSTDKTGTPVKVQVDVEFFDKDGKKFDLTKYNAIVALNSLNHWDGAAYVNSIDKPRTLTVEAKDVNGKTVRGTFNPYADGSTPSMVDGVVTSKTGKADFGGVAVQEDTIKIVMTTVSWDENTKQYVVSREIATDVTSINASGAGTGHAISNQQFTYNGNDDVLGVYTLNDATGEITYKPKAKFQSIKHQESVNIGNNKFIPIPGSSVTYDKGTKEVTSLKDNQYKEHGADFNGEGLEGWDNENSKYLYYGGAGIKMTDGRLVFTAEGANADGSPTVYWFAINSSVAIPVNPPKPEEPKPEKFEEPVKPQPVEVKWHKNIVKTVTENPTPPTPPVVPNEPGEPTPPVTPEEPKQTPAPKLEQPKLPNTGVESASTTAAGLGLLGAAVLVVANRRKEDK